MPFVFHLEDIWWKYKLCWLNLGRKRTRWLTGVKIQDQALETPSGFNVGRRLDYGDAIWISLRFEDPKKP
ncbi:hypothetical protein CTI12_AA471660 [Artemisia annua]|uniref:Uncharacterized protein n=1 Tax=Artemisia annua TaxID=35608 RepID=A0A2U1L8V7_ARTAN|nr:hypothetical protein CTI12_AA471660 [Artemisia annua]